MPTCEKVWGIHLPPPDVRINAKRGKRRSSPNRIMAEALIMVDHVQQIAFLNSSKGNGSVIGLASFAFLQCLCYEASARRRRDVTRASVVLRRTRRNPMKSIATRKSIENEVSVSSFLSFQSPLFLNAISCQIQWVLPSPEFG